MKERISINTKHNIYLVDPGDIMYCKCNNSTTSLYLKDADPMIISKGIGAVEVLLKGNGFIRPHQSYLVNINNIMQVDKTKDYCLILTNHVRIPVSTRRRKEIMEVLKNSI